MDSGATYPACLPARSRASRGHGRSLTAHGYPSLSPGSQSHAPGSTTLGTQVREVTIVIEAPEPVAVVVRRLSGLPLYDSDVCTAHMRFILLQYRKSMTHGTASSSTACLTPSTTVLWRSALTCCARWKATRDI